ncbi:MAG: hypothetical protein V8Q43_01100 [Christensenellaceae bacterium]
MGWISSVENGNPAPCACWRLKEQLREEIGNITDPVLVAGRELSRHPGLYADFLGGKREADAWKL